MINNIYQFLHKNNGIIIASSITQRIKQIHVIMLLTLIVAISLKDLSGNLLLDEDGLSLMYGAATLPFDTFKYNFSVQPLVF